MTLAVPRRTNIPRPTKKDPQDTPDRVFDKIAWGFFYGTEGVLTIAKFTVQLTVVATECTIDGPTTINRTARSRANNCSLMEIAHLFSIVRFEWHWWCDICQCNFFANPPAIPNNFRPVPLVDHPGAVQLLVSHVDDVPSTGVCSIYLVVEL